MHKTKKNIRGITLIALVITIIVLLILAGVTIASLSGDNGILTKAKEAKEKTEQAQKEEETTLSNMENILESYKFENVNMADTNPAGAMPSKVEILENDANKGIAIKDSNNNEWVWVEVPKIAAFGDLTIDTTQELTEQNYNDIRDKLTEYVGIYKKGNKNQTHNWKDEWYARDGDTLVTARTENLTEEQKALKNGCGLTYDEYKTSYQNMLKSIYTYGGFWIGRYEAGIGGSIEDTTKARSTTSERINIETSPKAISQKDAIPYNHVYCSEAQTLAHEMNQDSNYTSSLMFGIQWDLVCKYLEVKAGLQTAEINSDSSKWGVYSNVERTITSQNAKQSTDNGKTWNAITGSKPASIVMLTTGASDETQKMNIYDLSGNELEFILQCANSNTNYPCVSRGGSHDYVGYNYPASYGDATGVTGKDYFISFRATIYKK